MQWNARMSQLCSNRQRAAIQQIALNCYTRRAAFGRNWLGVLLVLAATCGRAAQLDVATLLEGQWESVEQRGACTLRREITGVGAAEFTRSAGNHERFALHLRQSLPEGDVQVTTTAPPWHRKYPSDTQLATLARPADGRTLALSVEATAALRAALGDGLVGAFSSDSAPAHGWPVPASAFAESHERFKRCLARLPAATDPTRAAVARGPSSNAVVARAKVVRARVLFAEAVSGLNNRSREVLRGVLAMYRTAPRVRRVVVAGYSDDVGDAVRNRTLSQQRAREVTAFLLAGGIPADKIGMHYCGDNFPVADSLSAAGRADNRRATVQLEL